MAVKHRNGSDPLVVPTTQLSKIIRAWIARYEAEREWGERTDPFKRQSEQVFPMTAQQWLDQWANISTRALWRILSCETQHTSFNMAEDLLIAIGEEYKLSNGELEVMRNPGWSQEGFDAYMARQVNGSNDAR